MNLIFSSALIYSLYKENLFVGIITLDLMCTCLFHVPRALTSFYQIHFVCLAVGISDNTWARKIDWIGKDALWTSWVWDFGNFEFFIWRFFAIGNKFCYKLFQDQSLSPVTQNPTFKYFLSSSIKIHICLSRSQRKLTFKSIYNQYENWLL